MTGVGPSPKLPSLGRRGEGWVAAQGAVVALVVLALVFGPPWPTPAAAVLSAAGIAIAACGIVLFLAGTLGLGRSLTPFPKPKDDASLNEGGAFAFVRHPIYGGVILGIAGWSLATTPLGLATTAVVLAFLELKSTREEAWLAERYPGYDAYRKRVRWKFFPGLR
jgi:protein-S-isoprenylcysteine O-methyltransferase Ste14